MVYDDESNYWRCKVVFDAQDKRRVDEHNLHTLYC